MDAVDAFNKRLVKKIEVKGFELKNYRGTDKYLFLENIFVSQDKPPQARIELEINYNKSINRESRIVGKGSDLYALSKNMEQYKGYMVSEVDPVAGILYFTNGEKLYRGETQGDISEKDMRRIQIRETIISHFEKEKTNFALGIKTLSLFFIDEVAKYRKYDDEGKEINGEYGKVFEEEYIQVLNQYLTLFDKLRQRLESDGVIKDRDFQADYEFSSPSAASAVIMGHTTNGNIEWKTKDGKKLKDTEIKA